MFGYLKIFYKFTLVMRTLALGIIDLVFPVSIINWLIVVVTPTLALLY
jgi:hypothetical protein